MTDAEVIKLNADALRLLKAGKKLPARMEGRMNACNNCEEPRREWYMLRNDLWKIVNPPKHGHLCLSCLSKRFVERLGRKLRRRDFSEDGVVDENDNQISIGRK